MVLDVKRAFLYGDIEEEIYIELPDVNVMKKKGYGGRLREAMHGTRSAPLVWQKLVKKIMEKLEFASCSIVPCLFYNKKKVWS